MAKTKQTISLIRDVEPEKVFWLCDGRALKNLDELANVLENIDDNVWNYHVNAGKNDFANWIENVFGCKSLGSAIRKVKNPKTAAKKIREKIKGSSFWSFSF